MMRLAVFLLSIPMLLGYRVTNLGRETFLGISRIALGATTARGSLDGDQWGISGSRFLSTLFAHISGISTIYSVINHRSLLCFTVQS